jgi:DNA-binding transcriptional ArsR family regulator
VLTYDSVLDALSDRTRRRILEELRGSARSVGELTSRLPVSQPAISQHLRVLREAGLVAPVAEGTRRIYHLSPRGLNTLREYVDSFWGGVLEAFSDSLAQEEQ